jgi:hypothetical protein
VPATVLVTALFAYNKAVGSAKWRNGILILAGTTLLVVTLIVAFALPRFAEQDSVKSLISAAAARGFTTERVLGLDTVSHNAEFYAAGRLLRESSGKQRRFENDVQIAEFLNGEPEGRSLVLTPIRKADLLASSQNVQAEMISNNGRLAIFVVSRR